MGSSHKSVMFQDIIQSHVDCIRPVWGLLEVLMVVQRHYKNGCGV